MKYRNLIIAASIILLNFPGFQNPGSLNAQTSPREEINFNFGWKFQHGDIENAQSVNFNDASWRTLDLPHDFQFEQPWGKDGGGARGFKAMGGAWYRKTFDAKPEWKGRQMRLKMVHRRRAFPRCAFAGEK
jgi:hypothetical protein